ncbi:MAG: hypothetical protein JWQ63_4352 [Mucilaginibacter sp.]|nr:hypothetical protein [Mucilaginibacter sp.]
MYLIDLYCLGLKDTHFEFNTLPGYYDYSKGEYGLVTCEYALAHNIIYGAVAFAEEYGFKPHKDWAVTQFILEEDDDRVELMEIEFGVQGMPCFIPGPNDDEAKIKRITTALEHTAGPGNFEVLDPLDDEFDKDGDEFDNDSDEDDDFDADEFDEDSFVEGIAEMQQESNAEFRQILKKINKVYDELVRRPETKEIIRNSSIGKAYKVTEGVVRNEYTTFDNDEQEEEYNRLKHLVIDGDDDELAIKSIKAAIKKYSGKPAFYDLLIPVYYFSKQHDKHNELIIDMYNRFPDSLYSKIGYATLLTDNGQTEDALKIFNGQPGLNYLYPDRKTFYITEAADYYACMCRVFIALGNIDSADLYMNAIFKKKLTDIPGNTLVNAAVMGLCEVKMKKIDEVSG